MEALDWAAKHAETVYSNQQAADPPAPLLQQAPEVIIGGREVEREEQRRRQEKEIRRSNEEAAIQQMVIEEHARLDDALYEEDVEMADDQRPGPSRVSWVAIQEEGEERSETETGERVLEAPARSPTRKETPDTIAARELIYERIDQMIAKDLAANSNENVEADQELESLFQRQGSNDDTARGGSVWFKETTRTN